ncbi:multidrug effflux MFS transporter [Streptomyces sp. NPDC005438]|uniref:multidrug effflux MFS transporter n=1 Tax=Streptomyces sp. NPDC005438 TaxID=3156880 RepID=UPI0033B623DD
MGEPLDSEVGPLAPSLGRAQRVGLLLTLILGGLTAMPALSMDLYLPALPEVGHTLHSSAAAAQLTLTACMLGLALGQLVAGPLSDRFGRRRPLVVGLSAYTLASVGCALAPNLEALVATRALQGLCGAAGIVIARAIVRDLFDGLAMARFFSTLMLVSGAAPILAPVFGAQLLRFTDWRGVFVALAVMGVLLTLVVLRLLPETLAPSRRQAGGLVTSLRVTRGLLADRVFSGYVLTASLSFAALFAYVSASPFVVQKLYGASPQMFSLLFMVNSVGLVAMSQVNGRLLVGRVSADRTVAVGLAVVTIAAVALLVMTSGVVGHADLWMIAGGLLVLMSAMALIMPNASSRALMRASHAAGSASALIGTSQFLMGAVATPLVGIAGEGTAVPMATVQLVAVLLASFCFLGLCRPWRTQD